MYNLQHPVKMISWFSDQLKNPKNMYEMKKNIWSLEMIMIESSVSEM